MSTLTKQREDALSRRLDEMHTQEEANLFQNFVLGLLPHDGYTDVRLSAVKSDFGRDGVAMTPDEKKCFVAVSFTCTLAKIRSDAKRWTEDPNRQDAEVMLFACNEAPQNTTVSKWKEDIKRDFGLELRLYNHETILSTGAREGVWRETCSRLGLPGHRQGYVKVSPYDGELVRRALRARPPEWLSRRVELPQWDQLDELRTRLIFGKPGAGKTTTIFEQLERATPETVLVVESDLRESSQIEFLLDEAAGGAVIVFDDLQENHKQFVNVCVGLRTRQEDAPKIANRYKDVILLAATRSQEWEDIRPEIPVTILEDLGLLGDAELTLTGLDRDQCQSLIEICRDEWELVIEDRLLRQSAEAAAERDATPLFVISMLGPARGRDDRTLLDEHLAGLPQNVRELWSRYWVALDATSQGVLRLIRLFWAVRTPPQPQLLGAAAKTFDIAPGELTAALDRLERSLWLTRAASVPSCLDVQLEVIALDDSWYALWDDFVFQLEAGIETRISLHNGTGAFYLEYVAPRTSKREPNRTRLAVAIRHCQAMAELGQTHPDKSVLALALNNASVAWSALAGLETTREARHSRLKQSVEAIEASVSIYRKLGLRADLAMSLNNLSSGHSDLADLEITRDARWSRLEEAVKAVQASVSIRRELGLRGELAHSLNNASILHSTLVGLETTPEARRSRLDGSVEAVEESVTIYRELGLRGDLAMSLNTASNRYSELAGLATTLDARRPWLKKSLVAVEESVSIYRELGLRGDLATSLGSLCQHQRGLADTETEPEEAKRRLTLSQEAIDEAVKLFRHAANTPHLLLALQEAVTARLELMRVRVMPDAAEFARLVDEGLDLANSMQDEQAVEFFTQIKKQLTEGTGDVAPAG